MIPLKQKFSYCIYFWLTWLVVVALNLNVTAQDQEPDTIIKLNGKYLISYWTDTKTIIAEPIHWKARQWSTFAGAAGIWAVSFAYDKEINVFFQDNRTEAANNISKYAVEPWGSGLYSLPLFAGIYLFSNGNNRHRSVALTGIKAYLLSGGAAAVVKYIAHRHRPYETDPPDPYSWDGPFPFTTDHTSFPSGHTTVAFAMASVLACGYNDKPWIGITSYSMATLVGISRIYDDRHWASDVVAGAALGTFIGVSLSKINFKNLQIIPGYSSKGMELKMAWRLD